MADKESIDVLMTFIDTSSNGVAAESTSKWDKTDRVMMKDFEDGYFFEVDDFTFGFGVGGAEDSQVQVGGSSSGKSGANTLHVPPGRENAPVTQNAAGKVRQSGEQFDKYIDSGDARFKIRPEVITVTKQLDKSSIKFLELCVNNTKLQKAILVKRKFTGKHDFHEAFLRLEFVEPLIIGVEWDEGEIVREKLKFIHRGITAAYRPQKADGTLDAALSVPWTPQRKLAGSGSR